MSDPPGPPTNITNIRWGTHSEFVNFYEQFLDAAYPPASRHYQASGRRRLVESVVEQIVDRSVRRILDCAAGTGFPGIDLATTLSGNHLVHCCDGDQAMVDVLIERAEVKYLPVGLLTPPRIPQRPGQSALVLDWIDLGQIPGRYDYVLCRGNALAYADTWGGASEVAPEPRIGDYLTMIAHKVARGGYLHVDAPWDAQLPVTGHRVAGGQGRAIWEYVEVENGRREWVVLVEPETRGGEWLGFRRYSSLLTIDEVAIALKPLGFVETEPFQLKAERPNYGTIIARKLD